MKKWSLILVLSLLLPISFLFSQGDCTGGRYEREIFPNLDVQIDVIYGQNINLDGNAEDLKMDIYQPQGDTHQDRPLLILFHGGHFLPVPLGELKDSESVVPICEHFAKMGYVAVSADYRVGMNGLPFPGPDSVDAMKAVWRAVHDAKACVRYFTKDAATVDAYRIDPNRIYFGGSSAGAVTAVHYAFLDDLSEIPATVDTTEPGLGGGLEGYSGNAGYPSSVQGFVSLSGALGDTAWIQAGDEPLLSMHGTADALVPYGSDIISLLGIFPLLSVDGSETIHMKMDHLGLAHCLKTFIGGDHTPHMSVVGNDYVYYLDTTINYMTQFIGGLVCNTGLQCEYLATGRQDDLAAVSLSVSPIPADNAVWLEWTDTAPDSYSIDIVDLQGKVVKSYPEARNTAFRIPRGGLPQGIYWLRIHTQDRFLFKKICFLRGK